MALPLATALTAASLLLWPILEVVDRLQGDPEADVSQALKSLAAEQQQEVIGREVGSIRAEDAVRRMTSLPVGQIAREQTSIQSGLYGPQDFGLRGVTPRGGDDLVGKVAQELNIDPRELKARFDPRRMGLMQRPSTQLSYKAMEP